MAAVSRKWGKSSYGHVYIDRFTLKAIHNKTSLVFEQPSFELLKALRKIDYTEGPSFQ
jgi:hypothetical protein